MKKINLIALTIATMFCMSGSGYAASPNNNSGDTFTTAQSKAAVCFKGDPQNPLLYPYSKSLAIVNTEDFFSSKEYTAWRLGALQKGKYVYLLTAWLDKKEGDRVKITFDDPSSDGSCQNPKAKRKVTVNGEALKGNKQLGYQLIRIDLSEIISTIPPIGQDDDASVIKKLPYLGLDTRDRNQLNEAKTTKFYMPYEFNVVGMPPVNGMTRYITPDCQIVQLTGSIGFAFNCTIPPTDLSKGSPLIDSVTHRVIGLATDFDDNEKRAISGAEIWPEISQSFEDRLPDTAPIYQDDKSAFLTDYKLRHAVSDDIKGGTIVALPSKENAGNSLRNKVICQWQLPEGKKLTRDVRTMALYETVEDIHGASNEVTAYCRLEDSKKYLPVRLIKSLDIND